MKTHASNSELRSFADKLRRGAPAIPSANHACALGDAIIDGLEAQELVDAIEDEIQEEAVDYGLIGENEKVSTALAWERLREHFARLDEELTAIRDALVECGALKADDEATPLDGLITALFAT